MNKYSDGKTPFLHFYTLREPICIGSLQLVVENAYLFGHFLSWESAFTEKMAVSSSRCEELLLWQPYIASWFTEGCSSIKALENHLAMAMKQLFSCGVIQLRILKPVSRTAKTGTYLPFFFSTPGHCLVTLDKWSQTTKMVVNVVKTRG